MLPANSDLSFMLGNMRAPQSKQGRMPNTDGVAGIPRQARKQAEDISNYFFEQFQRGLSMRRQHSINWMKVLSILSGIHYFRIDATGQWWPLRKHDDRQIRAHVPVLMPYYRRFHGQISSNQIGITASPVTGRSATAAYDGQLAQDAMTHWLEETQMAGVEDEANQQLAIYGGYAYYAEKDRQRQQVYARSFPFCDLFPIPYDARTWSEMDGVGRCTMVTDTWLDMQDELYERQTGQKPTNPMHKMAGSLSAIPNVDYVGFSSGVEWYSRFRGARVYWVWMKPTALNGYMGEHLFMVENRLMGYVSGLDPEGTSIVAPHGDVPLYPVYYTKAAHDWWPTGFCEEVVPMQREMNRQFTNMLESAQINRGFLAYDQRAISADAIQDSITGLVGFDPPGPESKSPIIVPVPPTPLGREVGALLQIVDGFAKQAVNFESPILNGEAPGRVEGGPAIQQLNANAQAPNAPLFDRKWRALKRLYPDILDGIREVWPENKKIRVLGGSNLGKEIMVERSRLPGSDSVILSPSPLVPNGRVGMLNFMLQLRQVQTEDGPLLSTAEFRDGLQMIGLGVPGMAMYDKRKQRIKYRIEQLINDGMKPAIAPAGAGPDNQMLENHALAVELLKEVILDPSFVMYGPDVRVALQAEFSYHQHLLDGVRREVDNFNEQDDNYRSQQADNMLDAAENDPFSSSGLYSPYGVPIGIGA